MATSVLQIARSRVVWLLFLIVAATLTVNVLQLFEGTLDDALALAIFIPLVIGTGGNTGAQAATTVTRALAVGEVRFDDLAVVVLREARVGFLLPLVARRVGVDPAVMSAPFITTLVDATGLVVYFLVARAILRL